MNNLAADSLYEVAYRPEDDEGPMGYVVVRRLDDHEIVARAVEGSLQVAQSNAHPHARQSTETPLASLLEEYARAEKEFAGAKARWASLGRLVWGAEADPAQHRDGWGSDIELLNQLGGEPGYGNWASFPPPAAFTLDESDPVSPVLRLTDGRPFTFVGATAGYPWRNRGADAILVFFEPETRTAVLTFDWT